MASSFQLFSTAHLITIFLTVFFAVVLPVFVRKMDKKRLTMTIAWVLAGIMVVNEVVWYIWGLYNLDVTTFLKYFLPFHVCGAGMYLASFALVSRNKIAYEIAFYWGLAGTVQAVLTPSIREAFPSYDFVRFFLKHSGFVVGIIYATWGMKMRPRFRSIFITVGVTLVLLMVTAIVNVLLDANYMFLCRPPDVESPFYFLPWPWYIAFLTVVGIVLIFLLYSIFPITDWVKGKMRKCSDNEEPKYKPM